jgi:hypothetical protein
VTKKSQWERGEFALSTPASVLCAKRGTGAFRLNGSVLGATTELAASGVQCIGSTISNTTVAGENMAVDAGRLRLTGVTVLKPAGCTVAETLETEPLSTRLQMDTAGEGVTYDRFEPTGGLFLSLKISGCAIAGTYPLEGFFYGQALNATGTLAANQPLVFDATTNGFGGLKLGGKPAGIAGELNVELVTGEAFRATEK